MSSIHGQERAESFEDLFANILKTHLPARAAVATHRHIIGADSENTKATKGKGPSKQIDVVVYNEWTTMPNLLNQGYILAESVYLALEVKARKGNLISAVAEALENISYAKVAKKLRPETMYFGNVRKEGELSLSSVRLWMPSFGVVVMPWKNSKVEKHAAKKYLDKISKKLADKKRLQYYPDVIYVPKQFLAFKVVTKAEIDGCMCDVQVDKSEYPFLEENCSTTPLTLQSPAGRVQVVYRYLEPNRKKPNLLYVFIFWLSQEILKFAYEVPDYHRYLLREGDERLNEREAANITKSGMWKMTKFNAQKDEWEKQF